MKLFRYRSSERIKKSTEFQLVYRRGKKITTEYFVWFFLVDNSPKAAKKLGITVTRAVGKANVRARIKRQVREFFRLNKESLPNGLFVAKARLSASNATKKDLRGDLKKVISRL